MPGAVAPPAPPLHATDSEAFIARKPGEKKCIEKVTIIIIFVYWEKTDVSLHQIMIKNTIQ